MGEEVFIVASREKKLALESSNSGQNISLKNFRAFLLVNPYSCKEPKISGGQQMEIDLTGFRKFQRYFDGKAKNSIIPKAEAIFVNNLAFDAKDSTGSYLERVFTLRAPRFVKSQLRVQKASYGGGVSWLGAVQDYANYTSLVEQETGKKAKRKKVATIESRGSKSRRVRPRYRMRPGKRYPKPEQYKGNTQTRKAATMLWRLSRRNFKRPFIIHGATNFPSGLYRFRGSRDGQGKRKLELLQIFEARQRGMAQPKRVPWLRDSTNKFTQKANLERRWTIAMARAGMRRGMTFP